MFDFTGLKNQNQNCVKTRPYDEYIPRGGYWKMATSFGSQFKNKNFK